MRNRTLLFGACLALASGASAQMHEPPSAEGLEGVTRPPAKIAPAGGSAAPS